MLPYTRAAPPSPPVARLIQPTTAYERLMLTSRPRVDADDVYSSNLAHQGQTLPSTVVLLSRVVTSITVITIGVADIRL